MADVTAEDYESSPLIDPNVVYPIARPNSFTMDGVDYVSYSGTTITATSAKAGSYFIIGAVVLLFLVAALRR